MTIEQLINEFKVLEQISKDTYERCYKARVKLEGIYPLAGSSKKVLSEEKKASLVVKFRKSTHKKKAI